MAVHNNHLNSHTSHISWNELQSQLEQSDENNILFLPSKILQHLQLSQVVWNSKFHSEVKHFAVYLHIWSILVQQTFKRAQVDCKHSVPKLQQGGAFSSRPDKPNTALAVHWKPTCPYIASNTNKARFPRTQNVFHTNGGERGNKSWPTSLQGTVKVMLEHSRFLKQNLD